MREWQRVSSLASAETRQAADCGVRAVPDANDGERGDPADRAGCWDRASERVVGAI